jgi:hypothetical protein
MIERRVDGVATMTVGMEELLLEDLKPRRVPLVFIDVGPALPRVSNIRIDYLHGIRQALQHLAASPANRLHYRPAELEICCRAKEFLPAVHSGNWAHVRPALDCGGRSHDRRRCCSGRTNLELSESTHGYPLPERHDRHRCDEEGK